MGVRAGDRVGIYAAQVDRRRRRDLRRPEGGRGLRARRPDRAAAAQRLHPRQLRGGAWPGRAALRGALPRGDAGARPRRRRCSSSTRPAAARGLARRARPAKIGRPPPRRRDAPSAAGRPRLHPLHLRLDREAQGRDALARERAAASSTGAPRPSRRDADDRFSSHAPFHFDLSILDIYVALKHGATLVLIGEDDRQGARSGWPQLIADRRITVWYSAPSILSLLAQYGELERHDFSALRLVLFAGEVFPVKHLRAPARPGAARPATSTSTGRPRPTSAPTTRFPAGSRTSAPSPSRSAASARTAGRGSWIRTGATCRAGEEGELCIAGPG